MLRELKIQEYKPVRCDLKTNSAVVTGMGVVLDLANGKVKFPTAASDDNVYVVDKERVLPATDARVNVADSDPAFNEYAAGELVKVKHYNRGERFATDQYDAGSYTVGTTYMVVGTDGKWEAKSSGTSKYLYGGEVKLANKTFIVIDVVA